MLKDGGGLSFLYFEKSDVSVIYRASQRKGYPYRKGTIIDTFDVFIYSNTIRFHEKKIKKISIEKIFNKIDLIFLGKSSKFN